MKLALMLVLLVGCQRALCELDGGQVLCVESQHRILGTWFDFETCYCIVSAHRSWQFR